MMVKKIPNPVDVHVGGRVRMRRILIGLSQEKLGEQLGLTFQQVQKYEKGSNRISASRLWQMARILGVPVAFFFDDIPDTPSESSQPGFGESAGETALMDFLSSTEGFQLNRAFSQIEQPNVRRKLVELAKALADN
ncbi:MAG: helix-turn-helix transcriptional regulator [Rhizobiales bacterium]|nr:helix-turn-helix transcriptional regulator [Hyphomicrobiales bacterium]